MTKPISKSKRQLAQLLIEAGVTQFPEGANWAAQDRDFNGVRGVVYKYADLPIRGGDSWSGMTHNSPPVKLTTLIHNWHQTVLSRDEFDQIVAETAPDADGWIEWKGGECPVERGALLDVKFEDGMVMLGAPTGLTGGEFERNLINWSDNVYDGARIAAYRLHKPEQAGPQYCESVTRSIPEPTTTPTLDQLLQDWRNADDYAQRKQTEADEAAAMRDERWQAVQARAGEMGVTVGRCESVATEPETVITDYHHLHIGDILRCKSVPCGARCRIGDEGALKRTENTPVAGGVYVDVCGRDWFGVFGEHWEFIRRP